MAAPAIAFEQKDGQSYTGSPIYLKGQKNDTGFNKAGWQNIFYLGGAETAADPSVWHLVINSYTDVVYMQLDFGANGIWVWEYSDGFSTNSGGNNPGFVVVAPADWVLEFIDIGNNKNVSDSFIVYNGGNNTQFNVSGYHKGSGGDGAKDKYGDLLIGKTVDGALLADWFAGLDDADFTLDGLIDDIVFKLYAVAGKGGAIADGTDPVAYGRLGAGGAIQFHPYAGADLILGSGWYAVVEELDGLAVDVFEDVGPQYFYINAVKIGDTTRYLAGGGGTFDYNAFYTIVNGYGSGYTLGYPGLNNNGDIFPIAVKNAATGAVYPSFCFNAGSRAFAGESGLGCAGYLVANKMDKVAKFEDYVSAYNYIEDKYGSLDDNRAIAQIITWHLLGSIAIPSTQFDNINWAAIENGTGAVKGVADAKAKVEDVAENYKGYVGKGKIVDIAVMLCEEGHDAADCQPQLVPIYDSGTFDNKAIKLGGLVVKPAVAELTIWTQKYIEIYERERSPYKYVSQGYGSVTATNAGVKTNIVANSNHFTFAKLLKTDLAKGIALDLVVGNKVDTCGSAFVKLVDGKLEITIDDVYKSSFGAVAFDGFIPTVKNGNIHSTGIFGHASNGAASTIDVYDTGSFQSKDKKGANYDKDWADITKNVKTDDKYIYLYLHGDFTFDLTASANPGDGYEYCKANNWWWGPWSAPKWTGEDEVVGERSSESKEIVLDIAVTVTDADGTEIYSGTFAAPDGPDIAIEGLKPGTYTVAWSWEYPGGDPAYGLDSEDVEVIAGKVTDFQIPDISITQIEVEKDYAPGTKGIYDEGIDQLTDIWNKTPIVVTMK